MWNKLPLNNIKLNSHITFIPKGEKESGYTCTVTVEAYKSHFYPQTKTNKGHPIVHFS